MVHVWGVISKMDNKRVFYQDFLFEDMPVDKQDNPLVELAYIKEKEELAGCEFIEVSFDFLMKMNKEMEWHKLFKKVENANIIIKDDISIENVEIVPYKDFYLKTYFYNLSKRGKNCFVMK